MERDPFVQRHPQAEEDLRNMQENKYGGRQNDVDAFGQVIENPELHKQQQEVSGKLRETMVQLESRAQQIQDHTLRSEAQEKLKQMRKFLNEPKANVDRFEELNKARLAGISIETMILNEKEIINARQTLAATKDGEIDTLLEGFQEAA